MQTNDLNKMLSTKICLEDFTENQFQNEIYATEFNAVGLIPTKKELKQNKKPISEKVLQEVRKIAEYYQTLGKSRRWIKRYIKRKFNITEY